MLELRCLGLLIVGLVCTTIASGQILKEATKLADQPSGKQGVSTVPANAPVKILERQGFWVKVEAAGQAGWIKATGLNFSTASGGPIAIDTGRLGKGNIVATSAARGLSAKDLLEGKPNPKEVEKLSVAMVDDATVQSFLRQGAVSPVQLTVSLREVASPKSAAPAEGSSKSAGGKAESGGKQGNDDW